MVGVALEEELLHASRQGNMHKCLKAFEQLCNVKKVSAKWDGLYMIGVPRMFMDVGRVTRARRMLEGCIGGRTYYMFRAITDCVKEYFPAARPVGDDVSSEDNWALFSALSLKYWLGSVVLSDLSTLFGKVNMEQKHQFASFQKRKESWLMTVPVHAAEGSESKFYEEFDIEVNDMFSSILSPTKTVSFEAFVADFGTWAKSGAVQRREYNPLAGLKKTKWSYALTHSTSEIMAFLESEHGRPVIYEKFIKPEQAAARWALTGSLAAHILMSYVSWHLDQKLSDFPELFIFQSTAKQAENWAQRCTQAKMGCYFITGDYSGWDESVTFRMTTSVAKAVLAWVRRWNKVWADYWSIDIINALQDFVVDGEVCKNGLPTGSRWTMMLNSVMNRVIQRMAAKRSKCYDFFVVGDDFDVAAPSYEAATHHLQVLKSFGFETAAHKTGIYYGQGEFLKNYYSKDTLCMSPFRVMRSLLYAQDVERTESDAERRLSRADMWARLKGRLRGWARVPTIYNDRDIWGCDALMVKDMIRAFRSIKDNLVMDWLHTPSCVGGAGLFSDSGERGWCAIRATMGPTRAERVLSYSVLQRKHHMERIMASYLSQKIVDTYVSKQLPESFTVAVDLGRPHWRLHTMSTIATMFPTPRLTLPASITSRIPSDRAPMPSTEGLYTAKVFAGNQYTFKAFCESMDQGRYYKDDTGYYFTEVGLVEKRFAVWVRALSISAHVKMQLLQSGGVYPTPREIVAYYGETMAMVIWVVARPVISKFFTKSGSTAESLLSGVLDVIRYMTDTNRFAQGFTLERVGPLRL